MTPNPAVDQEVAKIQKTLSKMTETLSVARKELKTNTITFVFNGMYEILDYQVLGEPSCEELVPELADLLKRYVAYVAENDEKIKVAFERMMATTPLYKQYYDYQQKKSAPKIAKYNRLLEQTFLEEKDLQNIVSIKANLKLEKLQITSLKPVSAELLVQAFLEAYHNYRRTMLEDCRGLLDALNNHQLGEEALIIKHEANRGHQASAILRQQLGNI